MATLPDISESELDSLSEVQLTAHSKEYLTTGDHEIARYYQEELLMLGGQPVFGAPGLSPEELKKQAKALSRAVKRFADKHMEKLRELCVRFDYCAKMAQAAGRFQNELPVLKGLAEFGSFSMLGAPVFSLSWYLMKYRVLDKYICQCDQQGAAPAP
ncbi:hypothetical protein [Methyloligella solikamskensis]|uniref:Uncharacterized protein n=1 Tax=Methyloligella solikamskensis TaxID=1177756 RepID=A0ABW3J720_9HYPH